MLVDISNSLRIHRGSTTTNNGILNNKSNKKTSTKVPNTINIRRKSVESLTETPVYSHTPIYENIWDSQFPFYQPLEYQKKSNDNIDFTCCIQFQRNPIKKYSKPILLLNKTPSTAKSLKTSLFGPLGKNGEIDPINSLFIHLPTERRMKFGYLQLDIDEFGKCQVKDLPNSNNINNNNNNNNSNNNNNNNGIDELEAEIEDLKINEILSCNIVDKPKQKRNPFFYSSSPVKDTSFKPKIKVKTNSPKKSKNNYYSKWDKSMTISAKAIMKMVDDSLVSSDTEMYNLSQSFIARQDLDCNVSINANDLNDALMEEMDNPIILKLKELSI